MPPIRNIGLDTPISAILLEGAQALVALNEKRKDRELQEKQLRHNVSLKEEGLEIQRRNAEVAEKNVRLQEDNFELNRRMEQLNREEVESRIGLNQARASRLLAPGQKGRDMAVSLRQRAIGNLGAKVAQHAANRLAGENPDLKNLIPPTTTIKGIQSRIAQNERDMTSLAEAGAGAMDPRITGNRIRELRDQNEFLSGVLQSEEVQQFGVKEQAMLLDTKALVEESRRILGPEFTESMVGSLLETGRERELENDLENEIEFDFELKAGVDALDQVKKGNPSMMGKLVDNVIGPMPTGGWTDEQIRKLKAFTRRIAGQVDLPLIEVGQAIQDAAVEYNAR